MTIEFVSNLIRPSYGRDSWFSGSETDDRFYSWPCSECSTEMRTSLDAILHKRWSWEERLSAELISSLRAHFEINLVGRSPDGGFPSIILVPCPTCDAQNFLYAGVQETSNSVYRVVIQGLSRVQGKELGGHNT